MGEHIDSRKFGLKKKKKKFEGVDPSTRETRVSFKQYLREIEEELLDEELSATDDKEDDLTR